MECAPLSSAALLTNSDNIAFFRTDWRDLRKESIKLTLLSMQWRVFDELNIRSRKPASSQVQMCIDETLHGWALKTLQDNEMHCKT